MEHEWNDAKYLERAKCEPERVAFYKQYFDNDLEVAQCVCDNPPSFDIQWKQYAGTPEHYKKMRALEIKERQ